MYEVDSLPAGPLGTGRRADGNGSLHTYGDTINPDVQRPLEDAVGAELNRLNHLIEAHLPEVPGEIGLNLKAIVMPVVMAGPEQGLVITANLRGVCVRGAEPSLRRWSRTCS